MSRTLRVLLALVLTWACAAAWWVALAWSWSPPAPTGAPVLQGSPELGR